MRFSVLPEAVPPAEEVMRELVHADGRVRVARPRVQPLAAGMEREATRLLAVLLADAARRAEAARQGCTAAIGGPFGAPVGAPIATPKNQRAGSEESLVAMRDRRPAAKSDSRGEKTS